MRKLLLATALLAAAYVQAQDSLKTVQLNELAIVAIRADQTTPVTQSNIDRKDIQSVDFGQDASLTLEALSPSIISFSDAGSAFGNYHQFRLRGMDQSRINITLNGVPLNDMIDQGVFFSNFSDFSSSMESIQVQRGAGVSSNGTASYAGSVSYQSYDLSREDSQGNVSLSYGSFNSIGLRGEHYTGRSSNGLSTYFRVSKLNSDGYKYNSGSDAHSFFLSTGKQFDRSFLGVTAFSGRAQNQQSYSPVLLSDINADPRTNYFPEQDDDDFRQEMIQLNYTTKVGGQSNLNVTAYYGGASGYFPFTFGDQFIYALENDHLGALANFSTINENSRLTTGLHAYQFSRTNESATVTTRNTPYYADETTKNEFSGFIKWEKDLGDWTLMLDAQLRNVSLEFASDTLTKYHGQRTTTRSETFVNPKIGLSYQLSNQSNLYASFGRTGREPTRIDLMQGAFDGVESWNYTAFTDPNVVESEYVNDLEAGYRYSSQNGKVSVNGFYMSFENEISAVGGLVQNSYFQLRQNVKSSQRMGLELDAFIDLNENGGFTELRATVMKTNIDEFDTGTEILRNVEHAFSPSLILTHGIGQRSNGNTFLVESRYVSSSFMELGNQESYKIPGYSVINLSYGRTLGNLELLFRLNNVFNERYFTDGAPVDIEFDGTPEGPGYRIQAPRNFLVRAAYTF